MSSYSLHPTSSRYKWLVLMMTSMGAFMGSLDSSIVSVSLPVISESLKIGYTIVIWIPTSYIVARAVFQLSIGRLSDIKGRKNIFLSGFGIFVVSSFLCSISATGIQLMSFRFAEGVGGAFLSSTSAAIVTDTFPNVERGKALGINTMSVYSGLAIGPSLGGFLTYFFGWPFIFYINIPIGIFVIILGMSKLKETSRQDNHSNSKIESSGQKLDFKKRADQRFDIPGVLSFSVGLIFLLTGLTLGGATYPWLSLPIVGMVMVAGISLISFVIIEIQTKRRGKVQPMLDISLFTGNRLFAAANLSALLNYMSMYGVSFLISFYLQRALEFSSLQAGLVLLIMPVAMVIISPISGSLSDRIGSRVLSTAGMGIICAGLIVLSVFLDGLSVTVVYVGLLMLGTGLGLFSAPNISAVMGSVQRERLGLASGTVATMRATGQSISLAVMGSVVALASGSNQILSSFFIGTASVGSVAIASYITGMKEAFLICAIISAVGGVFSSVRGSYVKEEVHDLSDKV